MNPSWPKVPLGKVLEPAERQEVPIPGRRYRQVGVRLWGEGAYEREPIDGADTKYGQLWRTKAGDVIANKIWARNGSVAVITADLAGTFGSGQFPMFAPKRELLEPRWIHWLTRTQAFWGQCDAKSQGTSGKNRIRPERFLEIEVSLPPVAEQRRVVARIEELAMQVHNARGLRQQVAKEAAAVLGSFGNAVFAGVEMGNWPSQALEDVAEIASGVTLGRTLQGRTVRRPYLRVANVQDGHLSLSGQAYRYP